MKKSGYVLLIFFWLALLADCILILNGLDVYRIFTKTLLVPLILITIFLESGDTKHTHSKILVTLAFFFCYMGDLMLLYDTDATNFIIGLSCFLTAHLLFIIFFYRLKPFSVGQATFIFVTGFLILGYVLALLFTVWVNVNRQALEIPVTLYALVLGFMLLCAMLTVKNKSIKRLALNYFIPGALFFVLSDSVLAVNKFFVVLSYGSIVVMVTYASAIFLLANGAIKFLKK